MQKRAIVLILIMLSCGPSDRGLVEYVNGRQLLNLNGLDKNGKPRPDPTIERISPDSVSLGENFFAKIFLSDKGYRLIDAYFDCTQVTNPTVDTATMLSNKSKRIDGCTKGLFVQNDTIFISFTPGATGPKTFEEITVLTQDRDKIFRTQKYVFNYFVMEK